MPTIPTTAPATDAQLVWPKRSRTRDWPFTGRHREWLSRCRQYRISLCLEYPTGVYLTCCRLGDRWELLGRNRTLRAAKERCRREWRFRRRMAALHARRTR